jgi:N-acetylmuramoyl-L-alanine amidase
MPTHIVKQGECLSSIAKKYGFADWRTIYNHPENAGFRKKRPNPNLIYPQDEIYIPGKTPKYDSAGTGLIHVYQLGAGKTYLRIVVKDPTGKPISGRRYSLDVAGDVAQGVTGSNGLIEKKIPPDAQKGKLQLWIDESDPEPDEWDLQIGSLDPVEEDTGVRARLNNLGFKAGKVDAPNEEQVKTAVVSFQQRAGIEPDGTVTPALRNALRTQAGC